MKRVLFILICICISSITQAAIIAFEAEDDGIYYQAGTAWQDLTAETAMNGEYITTIVNLPPLTEDSDRRYSFFVPAGTYNLFLRLRVGSGGYNDDSIFLSNSTFDEAAAPTDYVNGIAGMTDVDGNALVHGGADFVWVQIDTDYVMADDATGYLRTQPREDGLDVDAFAYVPVEDADTVTGAELDEALVRSRVIRGAAHTPVPSGKTLVDSQVTSEVSWLAPVDPNLVSIDGYDVYFGVDPNVADNPMTSVTIESLPVSLDYDTTYYWRVDTHVVWDSNDISEAGAFSETIASFEWTFTTLPDDLVPVVTVNDVLTSIEHMPAVLTGTVIEDNTVKSIDWEVLGTAAAQAAKQMLTRGNDLSAVTADPNLLMDWIGTDTRNNLVGNPLYLSLKGLPEGTYNWLSYHHDAENQTGVFDLTVNDANGSFVIPDIAYRNGNTLPVVTVPLTITSNGVDDVVLAFDLQDGDFFVMNGFELSEDGGIDPLYIDFGISDANNLMTGYQLYEAEHEVSETFTEQSFSAFGTTVSIMPTWAGVEATVTDIVNDETQETQKAALSADYVGAYLVQLSATDDAGQTGSDTAVVTITADACSAAQLSPTWKGFSAYDTNEDCLVDMNDFVSIAAEWLDDRNMKVQE